MIRKGNTLIRNKSDKEVVRLYPKSHMYQIRWGFTEIIEKIENETHTSYNYYYMNVEGADEITPIPIRDYDNCTVERRILTLEKSEELTLEDMRKAIKEDTELKEKIDAEKSNISIAR